MSDAPTPAERLQAALLDPAILDLTPRQMALLLYLSRNPTDGVGRAAKALGLTAMSITRAAQKCGDLGLMHVTTNPTNRRQKVLSLMPEGERLVAKLLRAVES